MGVQQRKRAQQKQRRLAPASAPNAGVGTPGFLTRLQTFSTTLVRRATPFKTLLEILAVLCIFAVGIVCRLDDLSQWKNVESHTFYDGKPIHTTFDAWFYLSLSQDLLDDTYTQPDEKRGVPHCPARPVPAPLLSVLAAAVVKATGISLCWIGAILPAVLGPLLVVPLYLMGRFYGGVLCGLTACLLAVLYPFYIVRSNLGRFDTDCLILFFSLGTAYLFMRFALITSKHRYIFICAGGVVSALFLWWWDQTPAAVSALTGLPLLVALVIYYRPTLREGLIFYGILICCVAGVLTLTDPAMPLKILNRLWMEFIYISKDQSGLFPNIGKTITEQARPEIEKIIQATTMGTPAFLFAAAGFGLLMWRRRLQTAFLLPHMLLTYLAFTTANRFILFMLPLLALGTGYAVSSVSNILHKIRPLNAVVCALIIALLCVPLYTYNTTSTRWPKEPGYMVDAMYRIREATPENAVIWAWWDHGYALTYYARRATMNDGSIHAGELTVFNAIPYTVPDFRSAANFMHFYVKHGVSGVRRIYQLFDGNPHTGLDFLKTVLAAGPEEARKIIERTEITSGTDNRSTDDWLRFFFPGSRRPLYLLCDNLLNRTAHWWYWFGTWNTSVRSGTHPRFRPHERIQVDGNSLKGSANLFIDRAAGTYLYEGRRIPLARIDVYAQSGTRTLNNYRRSGLHFEYNRIHRHGALMDEDIAESVFSKLFIRVQPDTRYFKPVINSPPYVQLWEVMADSARAVSVQDTPAPINRDGS
jgi:hypothetical protein